MAVEGGGDGDEGGFKPFFVAGVVIYISVVMAESTVSSFGLERHLTVSSTPSFSTR